MFNAPQLPQGMTLVSAFVLAGLLALAAPLVGIERLRAKETREVGDLDKGLIGYWNFEGAGDGIVDGSGNGNDGVLVNAVITSGKGGRSLELSGDNDSHASIPASKSFADFHDRITVSAWVWPAAVPEGYKVVVSRQIGELMHPDQFYLGFGPADGKIHYKWHLGTIEDGKVNDGSIYTGDPVAGRWIHMVGVYDGKKMRLYVDGKRIGSRDMAGDIQVDDNPVTIGAEENGPEPMVVDNEFHGMIDEVRIYNRALSPAAVKALFRSPPS